MRPKFRWDKPAIISDKDLDQQNYGAVQVWNKDLAKVLTRHVLISSAPPICFLLRALILRFLRFPAHSAGELVQNVFGKHAIADIDSLIHQLKQHVLADRR